MAILAGFGTVLGFVGGAAAFLVVRFVGLVSNLALLHRVGFDLPNLSTYHPTWVLIPTALGGALAVMLLALWTPSIKGHGIPESLEAILVGESRVSARVLVAKPLSAAVAMGTGGSFGAEGPIIVTGGCTGSLLGQVVRVTPAERRILLATGAAAGMAGVFGTPIAAVLLAFELLLFERSLRSLLPLLPATGIATGMHDLLLGAEPLFAVVHQVPVPAMQLPLFAALGVAAGLLGVVVDRGLFAAESGFRRLPVPPFLHPLLGALAFSLIGLVVPGSLSVGYWAITDSVNGRFLLGTAAALCAAKLLAWWLSLASNTSGGTLAPIFLVGATMGEMVGIGFAHLLPSAHVQPGAFALVAMGATFGVASRALLTGGVFALEVTGDAHLVVPMLIALGVAELAGERFLPERIMTDKLVRRGLRVELDTQADPLRMVRVDQVMDPLPTPVPDPGEPCLPSTSHLAASLPHLLGDGAVRVVVTEGGVPVGVVTRETVVATLARRLSESVPQEPTLLRRPSPPVPPVGMDPDDDTSEPVASTRPGWEDAAVERSAGLPDEVYARLLALRTGLRRFQRWSEEQARAQGLTPAQHQLLLAVRGSGDPRGPTIGDVADALLLRHHSAVGLVDRAVTAGLVTRERSGEDHRVVRLHLTAEGADRLEALSTLHLRELERLAGALPLVGSASGPAPEGPGTPDVHDRPETPEAPDVGIARVYGPVGEDPARCVLVDRLWPRGVARSGAPFDNWAKDVAPSTALRTWYGHAPVRFEEFARRYREELAGQPAAGALESLRRRAADDRLVLLTATKDLDRSSAAVLRAVLTEE
jgi:H+/Cl- antiporter ClcA/uncharacterized protein YeaO (DUF488 family)/DNA-binding MarR family transcriptional regulator